VIGSPEAEAPETCILPLVSQVSAAAAATAAAAAAAASLNQSQPCPSPVSSGSTSQLDRSSQSSSRQSRRGKLTMEELRERQQIALRILGAQRNEQKAQNTTLVELQLSAERLRRLVEECHRPKESAQPGESENIGEQTEAGPNLETIPLRAVSPRWLGRNQLLQEVVRLRCSLQQADERLQEANLESSRAQAASRAQMHQHQQWTDKAKKRLEVLRSEKEQLLKTLRQAANEESKLARENTKPSEQLGSSLAQLQDECKRLATENSELSHELEAAGKELATARRLSLSRERSLEQKSSVGPSPTSTSPSILASTSTSKSAKSCPNRRASNSPSSSPIFSSGVIGTSPSAGPKSPLFSALDCLQAPAGPPALPIKPARRALSSPSPRIQTAPQGSATSTISGVAATMDPALLAAWLHQAQHSQPSHPFPKTFAAPPPSSFNSGNYISARSSLASNLGPRTFPSKPATKNCPASSLATLPTPGRSDGARTSLGAGNGKGCGNKTAARSSQTTSNTTRPSFQTDSAEIGVPQELSNQPAPSSSESMPAATASSVAVASASPQQAVGASSSDPSGATTLPLSAPTTPPATATTPSSLATPAAPVVSTAAAAATTAAAAAGDTRPGTAEATGTTTGPAKPASATAATAAGRCGGGRSFRLHAGPEGNGRQVRNLRHRQRPPPHHHLTRKGLD